MKKTRKWFQKKRYILPVVVVIGLFLLGGSDTSDEVSSSYQEPVVQGAQVKDGDTESKTEAADTISPTTTATSATASSLENKEIPDEPEESDESVDTDSTPEVQAASDAKEESEEGDSQPDVKSDSTETDTESSVVQARSESEVRATVSRVVDGDTVVVRLADGTEETLRLIGIDTPETKHPSKPVECFGQQATQKAGELLLGQQITLEYDNSQDRYDRYDRLLSYIILPNGTNFNKEMISQGYAYEYNYNVPYKYQSEFKQAERDARTNERGLWASGTCDGQREVVQEEEETTETNDSEPEEDTQSETEETEESDEGAVDSSDYECSADVYNCGDFSTHDEAQSTFEACGGVDNDIHRLDGNNDGVACESLQ